MNKIKEIYDFIDSIAPFDTALSFDNVGLLVGNKDTDVSRVLLALDITEDVCAEALSQDVQLIISHHPVIFKPIKSIDFKSVVAHLIKNKISAICAHTNLDIAPKGVNFQLASKLGLNQLSTLTYEEQQPLGLVGYLAQNMTSEQFAKFVKKSLNCNGLRYTSVNQKIRKIAVCSGSGGSLVEAVHKHSADAFVTGEIKHSDILKANNFGISIVDTGHYKNENVIIEPLKNMLSEAFPKIEFLVSQRFNDNVDYM